MKNTRKLLCALLVAMLLVLSVAPAYAAVTVVANSPKLYLGSTDGSNWAYSSISISGLKASSKITAVKSSNDKVIHVSGLDRYSGSWQSYDYPEDSSSYNDASINLYGKKKGKATISFKVDGKSYSKSIEVLGYTNPIKSFTITGIDKTNLKSKFSKNSYVSAKLKANAKAGYVNVSAASGWKVTSAEWRDDLEGDYIYSRYNKGVSSVKLSIPKMSKKGEYYIWLTFVNTKTNAEASFTYNIYH